MKNHFVKKSETASDSLKGYDSVLSGLGRPANTIYATVSRKYSQIQETRSAESIKPQIVLPPSSQFVTIKGREDPDVFSMMSGKSATLSRKFKIMQTASAKLGQCFGGSTQQSYGCRIQDETPRRKDARSGT
jgi:hypothetical protein